MTGLAEDPVRMQQLKDLLGKTETELYLMEGGIDPELVKAREAELGTITGEVLSTSDEPRTGPSSEVETRDGSQSISNLTGSQIKTTIASKSLVELEDLIGRLEKIREKASEDYKKRWEAYSLRVQGFSVNQIAQQFGVSTQLIYVYWDWCSKQLPEVKEYLDDFVNISVQRLEAQYRQLAIARAKGDIIAHKVSADLIDQQGKLLGAHKMHVEVDTRVTYRLEGVNMDEL